MVAMRGPSKLPSPIASARRRWANDRQGRSSKRGASRPRAWHNWALGLLCLIVVVAAITAVGSSSADSAAIQRTATVERGVVQPTVSGNGSLEAAQQVELNFGTSGEVTEIDVEAGQKVSKEDVLARIDSSSARASLASAEAQLSEAEETLEAASEAEEVSTTYDSDPTTVLASYEPDSTAVSSATEGTEAAAESAPPEDKEEAKGESGTGTTKPAAPEEGKGEPNGESGGKNEQPESSTKDGDDRAEEAPSAAPSMPSVEAAPGEPESSSPAGATVSVATAEAKLRQARLTVESARQEVRETALRAPISGTIASVSGSVGETVSGEGSAAGEGSSTESQSGGGGIGGLGGLGASSSESSSDSGSSSSFIVLRQLGRLKMEVSFSESDIGKVSVGQPATVSVSSMEGTELAGRVTKVDVLPSEGSSGGVVEYPATITLTQSAKGVRAGMSASAEVVVEQASNTLAITSEAITSGPGGGSVTVLEDGKEVERTVTTGLKGDETTQILSGVSAGETVVLPEITAAAGGEGPAGGPGEGGAFPGGGSLPSFGGGGPPGGFPGGP
jgi:multidrug efflux pump subunit AcrA (membrane-fusion protein)